MEGFGGALLLSVLTLSVFGCSAQASETREQTASSEAVQTGATPAVDVSDEDRARAESLLGWNRRDDSAIEQEVADKVEQARMQQDFVVSCMAAEGFEYVPLAEERQFSAIADPEIPRGSPEFARTYGLGISTFMFSIDEVGPGVIAYNPSWLNRTRPLDGNEDPNARYFQSLDKSGQAAFSEASGACWAAAAKRFPDQGAELRRDLAEDLSELDQRIKADDRFFQLAASIDDCMQVEGYTFTDFESLAQSVQQRLIDRGLAIRAGSEEPPELSSDERDARLIEIQQFELVLATEFDRCIGWNAWYDRWEEIADDYRAEFLATHWSVIGQ